MVGTDLEDDMNPAPTPRWHDALLDRSIVFSYDRSGYERHARFFSDPDAEPERDMQGRVALVTGANSGIGKVTARSLASRGAEVWMLCRSPERGQAARDELADETGSQALHLAVVDLSDLEDIRRFVEGFERDRVDVLVHNAGVLPAERTITADGLEQTVATNLVGPFLLTRLLRSRLLASDDARVIHVTSGGMYSRRLSVERLRTLEGPFDGVKAYAATKRALVVLTEQLAAQFEDSAVSVHAMHPGWADTPAVRTSLPRFYKTTRSILRTPEQGADTAVWLAVAPRTALGSGQLWFDRAPQPTHLLPWTRETGEERDALWTQLCRWTGTDPRAAWTAGEETGR